MIGDTVDFHLFRSNGSFIFQVQETFAIVPSNLKFYRSWERAFMVCSLGYRLGSMVVSTVASFIRSNYVQPLVCSLTSLLFPWNKRIAKNLKSNFPLLYVFICVYLN